MDLREAIKLAENCPDGCSDEWSLILPILETLSAAAKRELERQEKERPRRPELSYLEGQIRCCPSGHDDHRLIADILKALREVVVPNLKRIGELSEEIKYGPGEALSFEALKALGESP